EAKFTIFLVKASDETTLEATFIRYRNEMRSTFRDARPAGEAIRLEAGDAGAAAIPPVRSAANAINNGTYRDELAVGIVAGWIIELRSTFPAQFVAGDPAAGIDFPVTALVWTTAVRDFAAAKAAGK